MRCRPAALCLPLALSLLAVLPCRAGDKLRVCYDDWPPYAAYTPAQGHQGLTLALLRQVFGELHIELSFQSATQSRCLKAAQTGLADMLLFSDQQQLPDWGRSQTPTEFWLLAAWVPQDSPLRRYTSIQQFHDQRVGMVRDYIYPEPIGSYTDWQPAIQGDAINSLRQLAAKRVDVFFEDLFWTRRMRQQKHLAVRMLRPLVAVQPQYHLYRPTWALAMTHFEQVVQALIESGEMDRRYRAALGISYDAIRRGDLGQVLQDEWD
ncbi:transporter substrate-binding domain-containing protein [Chitinimonas sp.]|uniref:substrate-binding periplasmic protein n=1 Tax=Chitinimonas sp. TaxID=1934313 RepID=UPI002F9494E8